MNHDSLVLCPLRMRTERFWARSSPSEPRHCWRLPQQGVNVWGNWALCLRLPPTCLLCPSRRPRPWPSGGGRAPLSPAISRLWTTSGCPRRHWWTTWTRQTEGKGVVCWFFTPVQWVLPPEKIPDILLSLSLPQDAAEDQPCLSPSQSGRISVATHPPFPLLTQSPLPVLMMSLTAVNTVSMETPTTALAYISGSSPSLHSPNRPPSLSLPPSLSPPRRPASSTLAWRDGGTLT